MTHINYDTSHRLMNVFYVLLVIYNLFFWWFWKWHPVGNLILNICAIILCTTKSKFALIVCRKLTIILYKDLISSILLWTFFIIFNPTHHTTPLKCNTPNASIATIIKIDIASQIEMHRFEFVSSIFSRLTVQKSHCHFSESCSDKFNFSFKLLFPLKNRFFYNFSYFFNFFCPVIINQIFSIHIKNQKSS